MMIDYTNNKPLIIGVAITIAIVIAIIIIVFILRKRIFYNVRSNSNPLLELSNSTASNSYAGHESNSNHLNRLNNNDSMLPNTNTTTTEFNVNDNCSINEETTDYNVIIDELYRINDVNLPKNVNWE